MEIEQIEIYLKSEDSGERLKGIRELWQQEPEVAVPLLLTNSRDRDFLVRSFVAMGLGKKQTAESFAALLELMKTDRDPNVRAESANSLSLFGKVAATHLHLQFEQDDNWLVRRSILAALFELNCPEEFFEVCACGIEGEDLTVRESSIDGLGFLANTPKKDAALDKLLPLIDSDSWRTRSLVARALGKFDNSQAQEALIKLKEDEDHRVVGAALEGLV